MRAVGLEFYYSYYENILSPGLGSMQFPVIHRKKDGQYLGLGGKTSIFWVCKRFMLSVFKWDFMCWVLGGIRHVNGNTK